MPPSALRACSERCAINMVPPTYFTGSGLLDLPFGGRCLIYGHAFKNPTPLRRVANLNEKVARNTFNIFLLWVSSQIYEEALPTFYAIHDFTIDVSAYTSGQTLGAVSPLAALYIKRLRIENPTAHSFYGSWSPTQSYHDACQLLVGQMPRLRVLDLTLASRRGFSALLMSLVCVTFTWTPSARPVIELAITFHQNDLTTMGLIKSQPQQSHFSPSCNDRATSFQLPVGLGKIRLPGQLTEADCWTLAEKVLAGYEQRGTDARYVVSRDRLASFSVQLVPNVDPDTWRQLTVPL